MTDLVTMCIETGNSAPVRSKPYFIVPKWFEPLRKEVDSLLQAGIIQRSESPWSSPIVTVAKPNGSVRLCVDYRALNALTQPDPYQMPLIEHILDTLASAQYLSKLDLNKGFHQVQIRVEDRQKTAFASPWGKFEYTRMPFGVRNGPAIFQRLADLVLVGCEDCSRVYIDDIIVFSQSWDYHCEHLKRVLYKLREAGLTANCNKCEWGQRYCTFLGHVVGNGQVTPADCKVAAIKQFKQPKTKRHVKQFLGLTGYYRRFVEHYADHTQHLREAISQVAPDNVVWNKYV